LIIILILNQEPQRFFTVVIVNIKKY